MPLSLDKLRLRLFPSFLKALVLHQPMLSETARIWTICGPMLYSIIDATVMQPQMEASRSLGTHPDVMLAGASCSSSAMPAGPASARKARFGRALPRSSMLWRKATI